MVTKIVGNVDWTSGVEVVILPLTGGTDVFSVFSVVKGNGGGVVCIGGSKVVLTSGNLVVTMGGIVVINGGGGVVV